MKTRTFTVIMMTALLILSIVGSAMCTPTELPDQAAQKAVDTLQKEIDAKGYNWTAGITSVSELTDDEKKKLCGVKPIKDVKEKDVKEKKQHPNKLESVGTYPETFDWRDNGGNWMTSVKNQGCGDCWAFSVIGIVESKIKIQANDPNLDIDLSEQHLVSDCCSAGDCSGGWPDQALEYMYYTGVPSEACFPYRGGDCACIPCDIWSDNKWNIDLFSSTKYQIVYKDRISSDGPMSAVIKVYDDFLDYNGGVYQRTSNNFSGYHAIVIVGWNDTEESWIIKNSWGEGWGENGYGRLTSASFASGYSAYTVKNISHYVPIVEASASPTNGTCPLTVAFSATGTDYDGTMVSCEWDFGDGASSTSQNPTHTYTSPGTYTATIYVTDDDGHIGIVNSVVTCGQKVSPVTASASSYILSSSYAIDGDLDTYWISGMSDDCWIMFDFGETIEFYSAEMSILAKNEYSIFDISVSTDATEWEVICEDIYVSNNSIVKVDNISQARYVRLNFDSLNTLEGCYEFYGFLECGARDWQFPSSSMRVGNVWEMSYAWYNPCDGNLDTGWFTRYENLDYCDLKFDMGEVVTCDAIRFAAYEPYTPVNVSVYMNYFGLMNNPQDPFVLCAPKAVVDGEGYNVIEFNDPIEGRYIGIRQTDITIFGTCMEMQVSIV